MAMAGMERSGLKGCKLGKLAMIYGEGERVYEGVAVWSTVRLYRSDYTGQKAERPQSCVLGQNGPCSVASQVLYVC
jgi:hypothetical protein